MNEFIFLFINSVIFIALLSFTIFIVWMLLNGAPYAPTGSERLNNMILLAKAKKGEKMADLGSGDGRIVIEFAKKGLEAHGYEANPILVILSIRKIKKEKLEKKAFIHFKSFWGINFSYFDIITIYGIPYIMGRLGEKAEKELKPGSRLISSHFQLPNRKFIKEMGKVYLYKF